MPKTGSAAAGSLPGPGDYCLLDTPEAKLRLAATTTMAANLANEVNQPLTAAANYLYACATRLRSRGGGYEDLLAMIEHASGEMLKAGEMIRRMRSFIVTGRIAGRRENLRTMIERVVAGVMHPGADAVEIATTIPLGHHVLAARVQIEQVFSNLLRNAFEALAGRDRPRIAIGALRQGDEIVVRIEDNGPGLSADALERVFDPEFSTKKSGVGLGLPISRTIVEGHGGWIWAEALKTGGAAFNIALPAADPPPAARGDDR